MSKRALLASVAILWISTPGFAASSVLLQQTSGSTANGFLPSTITTNFDGVLSVSITPLPGYGGNFSAWVVPEFLNAGSTSVNLWSQLQNDTLLDWYNAHVGLGALEERWIATTSLYITPTGAPSALPYTVSATGMGTLLMNNWPINPGTGEYLPMQVSGVPVKFDFGTPPAPVVPVPSAIALVSLGLAGCARWRIRRTKAV